MGYARRVDTSHGEVRDALRELGYRVLDVSKCGGFVDLVARRHHKIWLVDVKTGRGKKGTVRLHEGSAGKLIAEGWPIVVLRNREEAIQWASSSKGETQ
jgi:Holliday junction resolvase